VAADPPPVVWYICKVHPRYFCRTVKKLQQHVTTSGCHPNLGFSESDVERWDKESVPYNLRFSLPSWHPLNDKPTSWTSWGSRERQRKRKAARRAEGVWWSQTLIVPKQSAKTALRSAGLDLYYGRYVN
jgi:hypothetical protein